MVAAVPNARADSGDGAATSDGGRRVESTGDGQSEVDSLFDGRCRQLQSDLAVLQVQLQGAKDRMARVQASAKEETAELRQKLEKQRAEVDRLTEELEEARVQSLRSQTQHSSDTKALEQMQEERDRAVKDKRASEEQNAELQRQIAVLRMQMEELRRRSDVTPDKQGPESPDAFALRDTVRSQKEEIERLTRANKEKEMMIQDMVVYIEEGILPK